MDIWVLATGMLMAINNGWVGTHLVFRGKVMVADAMSHAVLPGLVLAYLCFGWGGGFWMEIFAAIGALGMVVVYTWLEKQTTGRTDAALAVTFTWLFALGLVLVTSFAAYAHLDTDAVLFGNLVWSGFIFPETGTWVDGVPKAFWIQLFLLALHLTWLMPNQKTLWYGAIDQGFMQSMGAFRNGNRGLMILTALHAVWSFEQAGAILVVGLLIIPGTVAWYYPIGQRTAHKGQFMWLVSGIFAIVTSAVGISLGYIFNVELGATLILTMTLCSVCVWAWWQKRECR
jgi:manganese/zinc/iron transport system permease protein